jgi:hypothetical protein
MMDLFSESIGDLFRGEDLLFQKPLENFVGAAFQILVGFFIEVAMLTDQIGQGLLIQVHPVAFLQKCNLNFEMIQVISKSCD